MLKVNEVFYSIQGEGYHVGLPCLFIRFSGCNMKCSFCDTKYHKKGQDITIDELMRVIETPTYYKNLPVVLTGGEPLIQEDIDSLIQRLIQKQRKVIVETNGTVYKNYPWDIHICVSPKIPLEELAIKRFDSLKLLYPFVKGCSLADYAQSDIKMLNLYLQPIDNRKEYVDQILKMIKFHPGVRLSVQIHKLFKLM